MRYKYAFLEGFVEANRGTAKRGVKKKECNQYTTTCVTGRRRRTRQGENEDKVFTRELNKPEILPTSSAS